MVITAKQESLVVSSWNEMKDDAPNFALKLYLRYDVLSFFVFSNLLYKSHLYYFTLKFLLCYTVTVYAWFHI
jgi:hypothetical protein